MLEKNSVKDRLFALMKVLNREIQFQHLRQDIRPKIREDLDEQQREYFLHQQIKNIKEELGDGDPTPDKKELLRKAKNEKWLEDIAKIFQRELNKLDTLDPQNLDYSVQVNYPRVTVNPPWNGYTEDDLDLRRAKRILNKDHYGMEKVRECIPECIAVLQLRGNLESPILCLYGPPGVGKTSLGKSIAEAMEREYVRVSLDGLHSESEIREHRKTYIGAMPGRIIKNTQRAGLSDPTFTLDEVDKVTQNTVSDDPSPALLEVLDPKQNNTFHDNYLDTDCDLSRVLFIATADDLNIIPHLLLDRMELVEISGYITEEKAEIAKRHLIPKKLENTDLDQLEEKPKLVKATSERIIESYTRKSGVRQLERQINKAMRELAFRQAIDKQLPYTKIAPDKLKDLLGKPPFTRDIHQDSKHADVVTGPVWTSVGGEILFIETSFSKGKAGKLTLTGNLGGAIKKSAVIALEYAKAHISVLSVDYRTFEQWNIHIYVPEEATPKDGPSAGMMVTTSIVLAFAQCKVYKNIAVTDEITLRGKVLLVGGIKEKILIAKRAGITDIMMCSEDEKDVEEIPKVYRKGLRFHFVEDIRQAWDFALTDKRVEHLVDFVIVGEKRGETK